MARYISGIAPHVCVIVLFILVPWFLARAFTLLPHLVQEPFHFHGTLYDCFVFVVSYAIIICIPMVTINLLGIIGINTYPKPPRIECSPLISPFMCFRVVTRGLYPELVKTTTKNNIELCEKVGLIHFQFEVVTDKEIGFGKLDGIREIVVPNTYETKNGSMFKARALHYCWEDNVNVLSDTDWIIHLDEETVLTESSIIGCLNFVNKAPYHFGQGIVMYSRGHIVNWLTTLCDMSRVSADFGAIRFCLKVCHRPVFNWKGSFILANAGAERATGFDFGPRGSIAEDCYFGMSAWRNGFTFGFVDGVMYEKSTFTLGDYLRQRKRWFQGIAWTVLSSEIPWRCKFGLTLIPITSMISPFLLLPLFISHPQNEFINALSPFLSGFVVCFFLFGTIRSFNIQRFGAGRYALLIMMGILVIPIASILETVSTFWGVFTLLKTPAFHIVQKENKSPSIPKYSHLGSLNLV